MDSVVHGDPSLSAAKRRRGYCRGSYRKNGKQLCSLKIKTSSGKTE